MNENVHIARKVPESPTSISIDALEEIVRNCQRNEERLLELERHTRHERKKAERLLHETLRTMQDTDSRAASILENKTNNSYCCVEEQKFKVRPPKQYFVPLDGENEENEDHHHHLHQRSTSNSNNNNNSSNNKVVSQNKHLLERVEKLLAGDGTTTSSEIMSSQERQRRFIEKPVSMTEDDLDEKSLNIEYKNPPEPRQLPSACSMENELSTVDRLFYERTPVNSHRRRFDTHADRESHQQKPASYNNDYVDEKIFLDRHERQYQEWPNSYIHPESCSPPRIEKQTTTDEEVYQYQPRPASIIHNRDEELTDLSRRCEELLARLHSQRNRAMLLENSTHQHDYSRRKPQLDPSPSYEPKEHNLSYHHCEDRSPSPATGMPAAPVMTLQQSLELLRPEFISRSRQRARRIRLLREEREHNAELERERRKLLLFSCSTCCSLPTKRAASAPSSRRGVSYAIQMDRLHSSRVPTTYHQMKQETKKKYNKLPEVNDRRRQNQMDEIRRRNVLRAKLFRARLRDHVVRHGRTNIDESLTIIDS